MTNSKLFLVLFLGTLSAFGPFVTDLYLPALPFMSEYFAADTSTIQLTLTGSMVGLALGQLLIGPISDKYGRKNPIIISLLVYLISTVFIIFSPNIYIMIIFRFVQGVAASGSVVISRAVATDLYRGKELTTFFALLMAVNGLAPIISPIFGSLLLQFINWRGIFITLALIGVILVSVAIKFEESLVVEKRIKGSVLEAYINIPKIFKNKKFMILVFIQSFAMSALFGYIAASPFILQTEYGLSSFLYSLFFAINGSAIVIGTRISSFFNNKNSIRNGLSLMLFMSLLLSLILIFKLHIALVELGFFLLLMGLGIIIPAMSSTAMNSERRYSGSASAILGFFPFFFGGVVSPLVGLGNIFYSTSITLVISSAISFALYNLIKKEI